MGRYVCYMTDGSAYFEDDLDRYDGATKTCFVKRL